jgi:exodeoxyribonuclease VII small subunit
MSKKQELTYERAYAELSKILHTLQNHDVGLEELELTTHLQRAKELIRFCQQKLHLTEKELEEIFADEEE